VTQIRKLFILFFLFSSYFLSAQDADRSRPLREVFNTIEKEFSCTFAYKDVDLSGHFAVTPNADQLTAAIAELSRITLFNFTILPDNTIAVSKKQKLLDRCIQLVGPGGVAELENARILTPYQQLSANSNGLVSFQLSENTDSITVSYPGGATQTFSASELAADSCYEVFLIPRMELLSTVTLVNYLARGITKNRDGSITVDYDEFDIIPGLIEPDVLQTIQALPGIQSVNEQVSYINIRGGTNDQNLILWDGIKMYQSGHFFGLISAFNPFLTNKVTLIKNGSSAQYGDGVSGILSMEGDDSLNTEPSGGWGINLISTDGFADIPLGNKASVQIAGRKSYNNLIETPTYTSYFDKAFQNTEVVSNTAVQSASNDDFTFYDSHLRLLYQPTKKDRIRVNFLLLGNRLEFLENATIDNERQSRQSELTQENISSGVNYLRDWSDLFQTDLQFYATNYNLKATNFDILDAQRLLQTNDVLESGVKLKASLKLSENSGIMAGYQFNETGITNFEQINNPFFERQDKQVLRTNSFFSEITLREPSLNTTLIAGVRLNHIGKFNELLVEPRINVNHRFFKYFSVDIAAELKSQTTSQIIDFQNDFLGVENRRWVLARENEIPILKGQQISVGINYGRNGWLVNIEPYLKRIEGITTQSQGFQNQFENIRTHGEYSVRGIDFLLNKRFKKVNTWLSYSYADNDYNFEVLDPSEFPNNIDIRHTLTYGITYALDKFKISGGLNWHSGKPITTLVSGNEVVDGALNFNAPNASSVADYLRVDLSGTYSFRIGNKLSAFAGVSFWNLLNSANELNYFFRLDNNNKAEKVSEFALKFTPNATFRLNF
jgi:hypothetical protein